jgi:hypothetical protein
VTDDPLEYSDMTDEQKRIVDAGEIAGAFPGNMTKEELAAWIRERLLAAQDRAMDPANRIDVSDMTPRRVH